MATASVSNTLECSICCENLKTPKVLTCGHTYCLDCIERYIGDKTETFLCPICGQNIHIPDGGAGMFITNLILQIIPYTTHVTGTPISPTTQVTGTPTTCQTSEITDQPVTTLKHHCPNHSKKEVEYYCQTCSLGLCSKCIYRDHNDHKTLDLECDSTKEMVVKELSKSEQFLKNKIEDLEKILAGLFETSEKLKSFCDEACTTISEKTEKVISELKENCEKRQKEIRDHFDKNESQLTETRQKVMTMINYIKTDLDTPCPTAEEPSLSLIYSLTQLKDLQNLRENLKISYPPVTYVEWTEGSVKVCDILGSTEIIKLYPSIEGRLFTFNYKGVRSDTMYYCKERYESNSMIWCCRLVRESYSSCACIDIVLLTEDNPLVDYCEIHNNLTVTNKDNDKNIVNKTRPVRFSPGYFLGESKIELPWDKLTDPSEGFIDNDGQFHVRFDILQVFDTKYL